jgi:crossover junction endodeoxyribonuclease RuvC
MIWIGIDPGSKSGAFAIIGWSKIPLVFPWDNDDFKNKMYTISEVQEQEGAIAVVEKVGAMPKQGLSSTWVFAENFGYIQGVLHALSIPFQLVPPRVWKKSFSLTSDKAKSIEVCHRLFPNVSLKRTDKSHKDDNNLAEALLMAEYARRHFGEGNV